MGREEEREVEGNIKRRGVEGRERKRTQQQQKDRN